MSVIQDAARLSIAANKAFLSDGRELFVSFDRGALQNSLLAHIRLHEASEIRDNEPSLDLYLKIQQRAFLELYDRGVLNPVFPITDLGESAIQQMRRATGIGLENLPPPPPPELTPEEKLEAEVLNDWKTLSGDKVRRKADGSRQYRETLDRLLNSDKIDAGPGRLVTMGV